MHSALCVVSSSFDESSHCLCTVGAMSHLPILDPEEEEKLNPNQLSDVLIMRVLTAKKAKVSVNDQYTVDYQETLRDVQDGKVEWPLKPDEMRRRKSTFTQSQSQRARNLNNLVVNPMPSHAGSVVSQVKTAPGSEEEGFNKSHERNEIDELMALEAKNNEQDPGF